jgi:hypothetical protein
MFRKYEKMATGIWPKNGSNNPSRELWRNIFAPKY